MNITHISPFATKTSKHEGSKKALIFKAFRDNSIFAPFPHPLSHSDEILAILILQAFLIALKYTNCETRF